jgi:hypothetical protein
MGKRDGGHIGRCVDRLVDPCTGNAMGSYRCHEFVWPQLGMLGPIDRRGGARQRDWKLNNSGLSLSTELAGRT